MKAIVMTEFGPPSVLVERELGDPILASGHVMIEIELVNVTFVETQQRWNAPRPGR
jgi:NADPH2:quinone reductase